MKDFFFRSKKKKERLALPRKIFLWTERRCWQKDRGLSWLPVQPRPKNRPGLEISASGQRQTRSPSQSSRESSVCSYSVGSQMNSTLHTLLVPRKQSRNTGSTSLACRLSHGFSLHPSLPPLSSVSKRYGYISLKAKSIWLFFPTE